MTSLIIPYIIYSITLVILPQTTKGCLEIMAVIISLLKYVTKISVGYSGFFFLDRSGKRLGSKPQLLGITDSHIPLECKAISPVQIAASN